MDDFSQYDVTENDPYLIENSVCLKNKLGITDTATLNKAEQELTKLTLAELAIDPVPATFDLDHLIAIHQRVFCDVYPFAGELRKVEICKGGHFFLPFRLIKETAEDCFQQLKAED